MGDTSWPEAGWYQGGWDGASSREWRLSRRPASQRVLRAGQAGPQIYCLAGAASRLWKVRPHRWEAEEGQGPKGEWQLPTSQHTLRQYGHDWNSYSSSGCSGRLNMDTVLVSTSLRPDMRTRVYWPSSCARVGASPAETERQ